MNHDIIQYNIKLVSLTMNRSSIMHCQSCGREKRPKSIFCPYCGAKQKQKLSPVTITFLSLLLLGSISISIIIVITFYSNDLDASDSKESSVIKPQEPEINYWEDEEPTSVTKKNQSQDKQTYFLTDVIATAQQTVYTVYSSYSQGSGFLYSTSGAVITNAHVVEGDTVVYVKAVNGMEFEGTVIGYSNETDVAVIHVPNLIGETPFELNYTETVKIGDEVIALGSPLGIENTATMGYITGKHKNFFIDSYVYEDLYQMSAPISPGSSGGPLISKTTGGIIAINSAQSLEDPTIGFSIPLYSVHSLIESWIEQPMTKEAILSLFYEDNNRVDNGYFKDDQFPEDSDNDIY